MQAIGFLALIVALVLAFVGVTQIINLHGEVTGLTGGLATLWDDLPTIYVLLGVAIPLVAVIVATFLWVTSSR